jgi:hypothetical protein
MLTQTNVVHLGFDVELRPRVLCAVMVVSDILEERHLSRHCIHLRPSNRGFDYIPGPWLEPGSGRRFVYQGAELDFTETQRNSVCS